MFWITMIEKDLDKKEFNLSKNDLTFESTKWTYCIFGKSGRRLTGFGTTL